MFIDYKQTFDRTIHKLKLFITIEDLYNMEVNRLKHNKITTLDSEAKLLPTRVFVGL